MENAPHPFRNNGATEGLKQANVASLLNFQEISTYRLNNLFQRIAYNFSIKLQDFKFQASGSKGEYYARSVRVSYASRGAVKSVLFVNTMCSKQLSPKFTSSRIPPYFTFNHDLYHSQISLVYS